MLFEEIGGLGSERAVRLVARLAFGAGGVADVSADPVGGGSSGLSDEVAAVSTGVLRLIKKGLAKIRLRDQDLPHVRGGWY